VKGDNRALSSVFEAIKDFLKKSTEHTHLVIHGDPNCLKREMCRMFSWRTSSCSTKSF
jgi:hypothetical protein